MIEHGEADPLNIFTDPAAARAPKQSGSYAGRELNGRFSLLQKVAGGNRGDVYRAEDRFGFDGDLPGRKLAVKLLHAAQAERPGGLQCFKRSFHVAQSLSHPNVLSVYEVDFDRATGSHYMTMELLSGSSLRSILNELGSQRIPQAEALRIVRGICTGLMHMHSRGYVHGDIRPRTIFVTRRLDAVLTNFEHTVHRSSGTADGNDWARDATGGVIENHNRYQSPQVLAGQIPNNNDDVYSIACVCYELFSGKLPDNPPVRVRGLSKRHWMALQKALRPQRRKRTHGVTAFAREMGVVTPRASNHRPLFWALVAANAVVFSTIALVNLLSSGPAESGDRSAPAAAMVREATFSLESASYRVSENRAAVRIKVLRSGNLERPSSVSWWAQGDTATAGSDFVDLGQTTLQFPKGQSEQWIYAPIVADSLDEADEIFHVHIGDPAAGDTLGAIHSATVYIENEM